MRGFWVAEISDEVVGCIGLGESFINTISDICSLHRQRSLQGDHLWDYTECSPQTQGMMEHMALQENYDVPSQDTTDEKSRVNSSDSKKARVKGDIFAYDPVPGGWYRVLQENRLQICGGYVYVSGGYGENFDVQVRFVKDIHIII